MKQRADLVVLGAAELVTCAGFSQHPARGRSQGALGVVRDGAVALRGDTIVGVGTTADVLANFEPAETLDATGAVVLPGFVDPHTHLVFAGHRADEWEARLGGKPYLQILEEGGGIQRTVLETRRASREGLLASAEMRARRALAHGTTTVEIKSGYGLAHTTELTLLEVAAELRARLPLGIVTTYLGAHVVPSDRKDDRAGYLDDVVATQTDVGARGLARFSDVFVEQGAFTVEEARRVLLHARSCGLGCKLHAEQFGPSAAVRLALELDAVSVDHLDHVCEADIRALGAAPRPPIGVLLPGVPFHLGMGHHAPARALVEAGVPLALATDCNPGTSFTTSMPMILQLACRALRLSVGEAIVAATINAAHAVGLAATVGSLEVGKRADLVVLDDADHRMLGYAFGDDGVRHVIAKGRIWRPISPS